MQKKTQILNYIFSSLGKAVLGVYILHLFIISYIIKPIFEKVEELHIFIGIGILHIIIIIMVALMLNWFKTKNPKPPTLFYWVFEK
jgi:fucose 4-O-acetylase-like acetyltransferase